MSGSVPLGTSPGTGANAHPRTGGFTVFSADLFGLNRSFAVSLKIGASNNQRVKAASRCLWDKGRCRDDQVWHSDNLRSGPIRAFRRDNSVNSACPGGILSTNGGLRKANRYDNEEP